MYSNTANFGKICVSCIRKAPQSAVGECTARASCRQGAFSPSEALKSCTARKSCHPLMDLALAQGRLPQHPANTCHLPPANSCHRRTPLQLFVNARCRAVASARRCAFSTSFRSVASPRQRPVLWHGEFQSPLWRTPPPSRLTRLSPSLDLVSSMAPTVAKTGAQILFCSIISLCLRKNRHPSGKTQALPIQWVGCSKGYVLYRTINKEKRLRWQLLHIALSARKRRKW